MFVSLPRYELSSFLSAVQKHQVCTCRLDHSHCHNMNMHSVNFILQITFIPAVPPILVQLLKTPHVTSDQLASVKDIFYGAAPTGSELEKEWDAKFPHIKRIQG